MAVNFCFDAGEDLVPDARFHATSPEKRKRDFRPHQSAQAGSIRDFLRPDRAEPQNPGPSFAKKRLNLAQIDFSSTAQWCVPQCFPQLWKSWGTNRRVEAKPPPRACKSKTGTVAHRRHTGPALTPSFVDD